jgi:hypothetical protein
MKKLFYSILALLITLTSFAQEAAKTGIKNTEYDLIKKISIKNLDKDTYIKDGGFVLDNSSQPYVFKFSDGLERRIYVYKVMEATGMSEIANLMIFTTPKNGKQIPLVVPNPLAEKEVWGKYIDDLKEGEKTIMGFSSCIAFVMAKEFSGVSGDKSKDEDKYEYCFPGNALVTMADGSTKEIADIKSGDSVMSYNVSTNAEEETLVEKVDIHESNRFALTTLSLIDPNAMIEATLNASKFDLKVLEATANHPLLTSTGTTKMGDIKVGDILYFYEKDAKAFKEFKVFTTHKDSKMVEKVYNLITQKNNYLVNSIVVQKK